VEFARIGLAFAIGAVVLNARWEDFGLIGPADVAGLPVLLVAGGLTSLVTAPVLNAWSRRNERRADDFALALTGRPEAFMSAMRRMSMQNLAEERPSRAALWFFHTHPPIDQRIETARRYGPIG
jgi:STE24 endopeptidase